MAVATHNVKVEGKLVKTGETIPDLGSIKRNADGSLEGLLADESKLDNFTWARENEEALLTDGNGETIVKHFINGAWVQL